MELNSPSVGAEGGTLMKRMTLLLVAVGTLAGVVADIVPASGQAAGEAAAIFVTEIPAGYRDWRLISVAQEEGTLNDIRVRNQVKLEK